MTWIPGQVEEVAKQDAERDLRDLVLAVRRLNVDWDELARTCGDPKCYGDCRFVADIRAILARHT